MELTYMTSTKNTMLNAVNRWDYIIRRQQMILCCMNPTKGNMLDNATDSTILKYDINRWVYNTWHQQMEICQTTKQIIKSSVLVLILGYVII